LQIGLFTDGLLHLPLEAALDAASRLGVQGVEIGTGNFSPAPHCELDHLLEDAAARRQFLAAIERHQLTLAALNCSGNPLHPSQEVAQPAAEVTRKTLRLAGMLGIERVVCMSGCPGVPGGGPYPNWVVASWPEDFLELLEWQWSECLLPFWRGMVELARAEGVAQLCFELHPANNVYNLSSFQRLRTELGTTVAANLDPSHFFFQSMDPLAVIRCLGNAIGYVHAKDARVEPYNLAVQGSLDLQPGKPVRDLVWAYRTLGYGHDELFWANFVSALRSVGYDGFLSIEHEDPLMDSEEAIERAVSLLRKMAFFRPPSVLAGAPPAF
jgi:sugar phosphate isomerase/epimerase